MEAHADDEYDYKVNSFVQLLVNTVNKGAGSVTTITLNFALLLVFFTPN